MAKALVFWDYEGRTSRYAPDAVLEAIMGANARLIEVFTQEQQRVVFRLEVVAGDAGDVDILVHKYTPEVANE
jgi:hypothetical protein